jgi:hypothetical protein
MGDQTFGRGMSYYVIEIRLKLSLAPGALADELDDAENDLMKRIMPLPIHAVGRDMLNAPPDALADEYADIAGLTVEVEPSSVETVLNTVANWLAGVRGVRLTISIAGDSMALSRLSDEELTALERFIDRHGSRRR